MGASYAGRVIDVFGWVAAAIGLSAGIPQLLRIVRASSSLGVSMRLWQITAATTCAWGVHGFLIGAPQMQVPNIIGAAMSFWILIFVLRDRKQAILPQLVLPLLLAAALVGVEVMFGAVVFGRVVVVPQLIGQVAQLRSLLTTSNPAGVSAGFLAIFVFGQSLWFIFGIAFNDWALIICAGGMVAIASINLIVCLVRQARARMALAV